MKRLLALSFALLLPLHGQDGLSDLDRQLLLEKLKQIRESSNNTVKGRYSVALSAFRKARDNDAAAYELFLNCTNKVDFEDQIKKQSEFREWKKRHKERSDSKSFRLALRHQLNWLILCVEASQVDDVSSLSSKAIAAIEAILRDAEDLQGHTKLLRSDPLASVFAKAYSVDQVEIGTWPKDPLDIGEIYQSVILPPLRTPESLDALRNAWLKRITQEGLLRKGLTKEASGDRDRKPAFENWLNEGRKDLSWKMEVDLYRHGDQKASALRMLELIEQNLAHKSAPKWIAQFTRLVEGKADEGEETDSEEATQ